jgi:hypothetical protein
VSFEALPVELLVRVFDLALHGENHHCRARFVQLGAVCRGWHQLLRDPRLFGGCLPGLPQAVGLRPARPCRSWQEAVLRDHDDCFQYRKHRPVTAVKMCARYGAARCLKRLLSHLGQGWAHSIRGSGPEILDLAVCSDQASALDVLFGDPIFDGLPWSYASEDAAFKGKAQSYRWFVEHGLHSPRAIVWFAGAGDVELLEWIRRRSDLDTFPWGYELYEEAAHKRHLHVIKWLHAHGCPIDWGRHRLMDEALLYGCSIETIQWLRARGQQWTNKSFGCAVAAGKPEVLDYLHDDGCPWDAQDAALRAALYSGTASILWALGKGLALPDLTIVLAAMQYGSWSILRWCHATGRLAACKDSERFQAAARGFTYYPTIPKYLR